MKSQTTDGYTVTTVEQEGDFAGEEIGRVFLLREHGYDYWAVGDSAVAERIVADAAKQTRSEFENGFSD